MKLMTRSIPIFVILMMTISSLSVNAQIIGHQSTSYEVKKVNTGTITIDGDTSDWDAIAFAEIKLESFLKLPGEFLIKVRIVYDGTTAYFLVEIPDNYQWVNGSLNESPAFAMAIPINASTAAHMGAPGENALTKSTGYVDIMHWETETEHGTVVGGSIGGEATGNGVGNLDDEYAINPENRHDDDTSKAENSWIGVWEHSSGTYNKGDRGTFIFEYSRPMITNDPTDAQYVDGGEKEVFFAYWNPDQTADGWTNNGHYTNEGSLVIGFGFEPTVPNLWLIQGSIIALIVIILGFGFWFWKKRKSGKVE